MYPTLSEYEKMLLGLPYKKEIKIAKEISKPTDIKKEPPKKEEESNEEDYLDEYVSYLNSIAKTGAVF